MHPSKKKKQQQTFLLLAVNNEPIDQTCISKKSTNMALTVPRVAAILFLSVYISICQLIMQVQRSKSATAKRSCSSKLHNQLSMPHTAKTPLAVLV